MSGTAFVRERPPAFKSTNLLDQLASDAVLDAAYA